MSKPWVFAWCLTPLVCYLVACATPEPAPEPEQPRLDAVAAWVIQLSEVDGLGAADRLARADADLVIVDPVNTIRGREAYPMPAVVAQIRVTRGKTAPRKLCLAYVNVGQAESYRAYWDETAAALVVGEDPEGWTENFPVRYWDPAWRDLLNEGLVPPIVDGGYDGVFLDWVAGFEDANVAAAAKKEGVDPAKEMASLVADLAEHLRALRPGFLVVANGGEFLVEQAPAAARSLDGIVAECLTFTGKATSDWEAAENADIPADGDLEARLVNLKRCRAKGLVVLTLDYATSPENKAAAERFAREHGFVPTISRSPLSRLPDRAVRP